MQQDSHTRATAVGPVGLREGPHAFYLDPPQESPAPGWPWGVPAVGWHLATGRSRGWAETLWGLHLGEVPGGFGRQSSWDHVSLTREGGSEVSSQRGGQ